MAEVFAGFMVGAALSLLVAPFGGWLLVSAGRHADAAREMAPPGTNVVALSMVVHFGAFLLLTAVGIVLGLALGGIEDRRPAGGLGSPNVTYTVMVLALVAVIAIPTLALPGIRRFTIPVAVILALAFGWVAPWLAQAA